VKFRRRVAPTRPLRLSRVRPSIQTSTVASGPKSLRMVPISTTRRLAHVRANNRMSSMCPIASSRNLCSKSKRGSTSQSVGPRTLMSGIFDASVGEVPDERLNHVEVTGFHKPIRPSVLAQVFFLSLVSEDRLRRGDRYPLPCCSILSRPPKTGSDHPFANTPAVDSPLTKDASLQERRSVVARLSTIRADATPLYLKHTPRN
jgi:hypothetical protein